MLVLSIGMSYIKTTILQYHCCHYAIVFSESPGSWLGFWGYIIHFIPFLLGDHSVISFIFHSFFFGEFPFTFYKQKLNFPQVTGNMSLKFLIIFQFGCLPTVNNLHLQSHVTPHDIWCYSLCHTLSHTATLATHSQAKLATWHWETRFSITTVNARLVTHMVLPWSQIIGSGVIPCLRPMLFSTSS